MGQGLDMGTQFVYHIHMKTTKTFTLRNAYGMDLAFGIPEDKLTQMIKHLAMLIGRHPSSIVAVEENPLHLVKQHDAFSPSDKNVSAALGIKK